MKQLIKPEFENLYIVQSIKSSKEVRKKRETVDFRLAESWWQLLQRKFTRQFFCNSVTKCTDILFLYLFIYTKFFLPLQNKTHKRFATDYQKLWKWVGLLKSIKSEAKPSFLWTLTIWLISLVSFTNLVSITTVNK